LFRIDGHNWPLGPVFEDHGELEVALINMERSTSLAELELQVAQFAATGPTPIGLAIFTNRLANTLGINLNNLVEEAEQKAAAE
jgi:hypothetical protein